MSEKLEILENIKGKIFVIRGKQVMLDRDLAIFYDVEVKNLKRQVRRNKERFPEEFMFQLTSKEFLRCQNVTSKKGRGGIRYHPYAFTEQGVAMLATVLKSDKAITASINIMKAFLAMRNFLRKNSELFSKVEVVESKLLEHDNKINMLFNILEKETLPNKGIFFNGQVFDAFVFVSKLIKKANKNIILIDNYVNEDTLNLLSDKKENVKVTIYTKDIPRKLELAVNKFNEQYQNLEVIQFKKSHDRFLIIDHEIYHIGASLKDLGKKWFAFSKLDLDVDMLLSRLK